MAKIEIQKANGRELGTLPVFGELTRRFDGIRDRAFELFEKRGCEAGHELEDWLMAERQILGSSPAKLVDNRLRDHHAQPGHPVAQPFRYVATVQRQARNAASSTCSFR